MKKFVLTSLFISFSLYGAGPSNDDIPELIVEGYVATYECQQDECGSELPEMSFFETNLRGNELIFSAETISVTEKSITFHNPKINDRQIDPYVQVCRFKNTNFFGREVCKQYELEDISHKLCKMLKLGSIVTHTTKIFHGGSTPHYIRYDLKKKKWNPLYVSMLAFGNGMNYRGIESISCSY